ncbi:MAG: hypothetical protein AAGA50_29610 [Pseudomonadota bacterium]
MRSTPYFAAVRAAAAFYGLPLLLLPDLYVTTYIAGQPIAHYLA